MNAILSKPTYVLILLILVTIFDVSGARADELRVEIAVSEKAKSAKLQVKNLSDEKIVVFINPNNLMGFTFEPSGIRKIQDPLEGERGNYEILPNETLDIPIDIFRILDVGKLVSKDSFKAKIPIKYSRNRGLKLVDVPGAIKFENP